MVKLDKRGKEDIVHDKDIERKIETLREIVETLREKDSQIVAEIQRWAELGNEKVAKYLTRGLLSRRKHIETLEGIIGALICKTIRIEDMHAMKKASTILRESLVVPEGMSEDEITEVMTISEVGPDISGFDEEITNALKTVVSKVESSENICDKDVDKEFARIVKANAAEKKIEPKSIYEDLDK